MFPVGKNPSIPFFQWSIFFFRGYSSTVSRCIELTKLNPLLFIFYLFIYLLIILFICKYYLFIFWFIYLLFIFAGGDWGGGFPLFFWVPQFVVKKWKKLWLLSYTGLVLPKHQTFYGAFHKFHDHLWSRRSCQVWYAWKIVGICMENFVGDEFWERNTTQIH